MKLDEVVIPFPDRKKQVKKEQRDEFIDKVHSAVASVPHEFDAQRKAEDEVRFMIRFLKEKHAKNRRELQMAIRPLMKDYAEGTDPLHALYFSAEDHPLAKQYLDQHIDQVVAELKAELADIQTLSKHIQEKIAPKVLAKKYLWTDTGMGHYSHDTAMMLKWFEDYKSKMQV